MRSRLHLAPWLCATVSALVVLVVGVLHSWIPFVTEDRQVVSVTPAPAPISVTTPVYLSPDHRVCLRPVTVEPDSEIAQFVTFQRPRPTRGPRLELQLRGPGYVAEARSPAGYLLGPVTFRITPPRRSVQAKACLRNAGARQVSLVASTEGQTVSRASDTLDDKPITPKAALSFYAVAPTSLAERPGQLLRRASAFKPGILSPGLLGVVAALLLVGLPAATIGSLVWALRRR